MRVHGTAWRTLIVALAVAPTGPLAAQNAASFTPRALSPFARAKAESLLRDRYPCLGCHEIGGRGGHIGPALTDVRSRRTPGYVYAMISNPQGVVPGTVMPRVRMPPATLELIVSYLVAGAPSTASPVPPPAKGLGESPPAEARALYTRSCAPCHGSDGGGDGPNASALSVKPTAHASAELMGNRSDDALFDTIFSGGFVMNRSNLMPPFGATLSRQDIWGLVRFIRTLCKCQGPEWSRDQTSR